MWTNFDMYDGHTLCIYDTSLDMGAVNKALVMHDVSVISSQLCNDTLEDYFKRITGGWRELLNLVQTEFLKLRRKKMIWFYAAGCVYHAVFLFYLLQLF